MGDALSTENLDKRIKIGTRPSPGQCAWEALVSHALLLLDVGGGGCMMSVLWKKWGGESMMDRADDAGATDMGRLGSFQPYLAISSVHERGEAMIYYKKGGVL